MKSHFFFTLCTLAVLAGCTRSPEPEKETEAKPPDQESKAEAEQKVAFDPEKGLYLSDELLKSQGVTFANAEFRHLASKKVVDGQVYRAASETSSRFGREKSGFAYVTAPVDLTSAEAIKVGQQVSVSPELKMGTVWKIERMQAPVTGKAELLIEIPDPGSKLAVGDFISLTLDVGPEPRRVLVVPGSAVLKTATGPFVYVKNGDYLLRKPVGVGITADDSVEILEGVREGETVVTKPVQTLYLIELRALSGGGEE